MPTPLYSALTEFASSSPLRMHMPGHKGKPLPAPELAALSALDFTELPPTGNLFDGGGAIGAAEELWAEVFSMEQCLFLTGGSTLGIQAALKLTASPGDTVLFDRVTHRAFHNAMALLDLNPLWLPRPWDEKAGVTSAISPADVENFLVSHPEVKTVCITSPTYYGIVSDIPAIAAVVHAHGAKLVVDGAHGAHLPFLGDRGIAASDAAVVSAHKTLPAMGQSALLFANGFSHRSLREAAALFSTSSPSYVMMAALDVCRDHLLGPGLPPYRRAAEETKALRRAFPALTEERAPLDPCRLTISAADGKTVENFLQTKGVYPEMSDRGHVVFILTGSDGEDDFARLRGALEGCRALLGASSPLPPPPEPGERRCSPRQALFAPRRRVRLREAAGLVAGQAVAPYPPGVPVIAPGEVILKKSLFYLEGIGYNTSEYLDVL